MMKVTLPTVVVSGTAKPERVYVSVQAGSAVVSSSEKLTVHVPGQQPAVIELREEKTTTLQAPTIAV